MNYFKQHIKIPGPITKDILLLIFITTPFILIDPQTALFVGAISSSILLMRRTILLLIPKYFNDNGILPDGDKLAVPRKVEIFELNSSVTMSTMYRYIEVLQSIGLNPRILIIRFKQISKNNSFEICLIDEVVNQLLERGVIVYLADVDGNIKDLFKKYHLMQKVDKEVIFYKIEDALLYAKNTLGIREFAQLKFKGAQQNGRKSIKY